MKCPKNPIDAVVETITNDVPTAIIIGAPHTITIKGIKKDPPDIPTAPEKNPTALIKGITIHKLTLYDSFLKVLFITPNFTFFLIVFIFIGIIINIETIPNNPAKIILNNTSAISLAKYPPKKAVIFIGIPMIKASFQSTFFFLLKIINAAKAVTVIINCEVAAAEIIGIPTIIKVTT